MVRKESQVTRAARVRSLVNGLSVALLLFFCSTLILGCDDNEDCPTAFSVVNQAGEPAEVIISDLKGAEIERFTLAENEKRDLLYENGGTFSIDASGLATGRVFFDAEPVKESCAVAAEYVVKVRNFQVLVSPMGGGSIEIGAPVGIVCQADAVCRTEIPDGTIARFKATAGPESIFQSWNGDCGSAGSRDECVLTIDGPKNLGASFPAAARIYPSFEGTGGGFIRLPDGSQCSSIDEIVDPLQGRCFFKAVPNSDVFLEAEAAPGSHFYRWSPGYCIEITGPGGTICKKKVMGLNNGVGLRFDANSGWNVRATLTASSGATGSVSAGPNRNCSTRDGVCTWAVEYGSRVDIYPAPGIDSRFVSWGDGACAAFGTNPRCSFYANGAPKEVTASFAPL